MSTLVSDVIDGSKYSENINTVGKITRVFILSGVIGDADERPTNALTDVSLPSLGDAYPVVGFGTLLAQSKSVEPINDSGSQWKVTVEYGSDLPSGSENEDTGSTTTFTSALSAIQITQDVTSPTPVSFQVGTLAPGTAVDATTAPYTIPKQAAIIEKMAPQFVLRSSRKETSNPAGNIQTYTGKLNSASVTIAGVSFPAKTLLCTNITADTTDGGNNYLVQYEFQYRVAADWKARVVAINPDTGSPYALDTAGNVPTDSEKTYEIYETENYTTLDL